jgi:hypothetical protein
LVSLAAAALLALAPSGCITKSCTEMGCTDSLTVKLSLVGKQPLSPGTYLVDVVTNTESAMLTCLIPSATGVLSCCEGATATISGCPVGQPPSITVIEVFIAGEPHTVSVKVSREGTLLGLHEFPPTYKTHYPNGPDCPGKCRTVQPESFTF